MSMDFATKRLMPLPIGAIVICVLAVLAALLWLAYEPKQPDDGIASGEIQTLESAEDGTWSRNSAARVGIKRLTLSTRPVGPRAPWNVPVAQLPQHPDSDIFVDRLWREAPSNVPGNFNLGFDEYTYPFPP